MALILPDGTNDLTITTGNVERQFGTFKIDITSEPITGFSNATMKASSMPSIEIDYDLAESTDDISEFKINTSEIEFTLFDELSTGDSFYNLTQNQPDTNGFLLELTILGKVDTYVFTSRDVDFNYLERSCTVRARPAFVYDSNPNAFSLSGSEYTYNESIGGGSFDVYVVGDIMQEWLESQGVSPSDVKNIGSNVSDQSPSDGEVMAVVATSDLPSYSDAQNLVISFALTEGAIIGVAMGYAFYVVRTDTSDDITLSPSQVENFDILNDNRYVRNFNLDFDYGTGSASSFRRIAFIDGIYAPYEEVIYSQGSQDVNVTKNLPLSGSNSIVRRATYNATDLDFDEETGDTASDYVFDGNTVSENNVTIYKSVLRIDNSVISGTILGIDTLNPYQSFTLDTGFNDFVDGKTYRPSYLKYNLEDNKIEFEAYSI